MGRLSERIQKARETALQYETYNEVFERGLPQLQYFDEIDEVTHQRKGAERRGIQRLLRLEEQATREAFGEDDAEMKAQLFMDRLDDLTQDDIEPQLSLEEVQKSQYKDVVENFLYAEWLEQEADGIRTFSHYVTFTSLKAFVSFMTSHKNSMLVLTEFMRFVPHDLRERCLQFVGRDDYDPTDPVWYIPNLLDLVPEAWYVSQVFVNHYAEQVRLEGSDSPLPDNPFKIQADDNERIRMRQAIHAYAANEGSTRDLAKKYGVVRRVLEEELRTSGVLRGRGGNRKG